MRFSLARAACPVVLAAEYLERFTDRGRALRLRHLGLDFFGLTDCLCMGRDSQAVGPVHGTEIPCLFVESCPYPAHEAGLAPLAAQSLEHSGSVVPVDEAAPLFPPGAGNLWHFVTESLPKLLALESIGYAGRYIVPEYTRGPRGSVIAQSLALLGIPESRLLYSGPVYRVERLMLGQRLKGWHLAENMALTGLVRDRIRAAVGGLPGGKRLYVRRIGRRRLANERDLLPLLAEYGFELMVPEELPLAEQWRTMTNVDCSLMPHGANTTLTLLQKAGSGFIEIFSHRFVSYCAMHAVRLNKLRYHALVQELEPDDYPGETMSVAEFLRDGRSHDPLVNPLHLRILLEGLLPDG